MTKQCEICKKWLKNNRGYNIHYNRMHGQKQKIETIYSGKTIYLGEILNRVRKLELDNNFMKHQLKHKVFVGNSKDSELDWDLKPEVKEAKNKFEIKFNVIIKELKVIFHEDFDYHEILNPIEPREVVELSPIMVEV